MSVIMNRALNKPRIFLGSSGKQAKLLQAITRGLEDVADVEPWMTTFNPGRSTLDRLVELSKEVDFAAFVFAQDDWTTTDASQSGQASPRDNVVFEAGLFGGALGIRRTFILHANGSKLPSDLLGLTSVRYDPATSSAEVRAINRISPERQIVDRRYQPVTVIAVTVIVVNVMENPFVYGEVVPAAAFINRVVELDRLVADLAAGQKVFLISPRRYGKSSLIRQALAAMARRGTLTVEVTVSSFSSYVAFLEGYARALIAAETRWDRARSWLREMIRSARAEVRYAPDAALLTRRRLAERLVPRRPHRPRHLAPGAGGVRAAGPARRGAPAQGGGRARRVPGDRRLQRRLGGTCAARRGTAPARGRLRLRRIGAEPDGADADAEAAVLQGRTGHAAREDSGRRVR